MLTRWSIALIVALGLLTTAAFAQTGASTTGSETGVAKKKPAATRTMPAKHPVAKSHARKTRQAARTHKATAVKGYRSHAAKRTTATPRHRTTTMRTHRAPTAVKGYRSRPMHRATSAKSHARSTRRSRSYESAK